MVHHYKPPRTWPAPEIRLPITLNMLIDISFVGPGDQLPARDSPIFKWMHVPYSKENPFNKKDFVDELVRVCGGFEVSPHDYLQFIRSLDNWSRTRLRYWQRIWDALNVDYEPLHNYDRTEEEVIDDDSNANSLVAGFDSGELVDESAASGKAHKDRKLRAYGNIGVTTSQEMLLQEINVANQSMQKMIIDEFKDEFCILVY